MCVLMGALPFVHLQPIHASRFFRYLQMSGNMYLTLKSQQTRVPRGTKQIRCQYSWGRLGLNVELTVDVRYGCLKRIHDYPVNAALILSALTDHVLLLLEGFCEALGTRLSSVSNTVMCQSGLQSFQRLPLQCRFWLHSLTHWNAL